MVDCYTKKHELESVSGVVSVPGLDQEGECESRILSSQFLITNSRLGVLNLCIFRCCMLLHFAQLVSV